MSLAFFTIPVRDPVSAQGELNAFLASHKTLAIDRRWVENGADSFWSICVDYLEHGNPTPPAHRSAATGAPRIDYKGILSPEDFSVFVKLRELRKELAAAEAVPVYTIFTNEQLASMVRNRATTLAEIGSIEGVGESRLEKYGAKMLAVLVGVLKGSDEAGGQPVRSNSGSGQPSSGVPQGTEGQAGAGGNEKVRRASG